MRTYDDRMFINTFEHEYTWINGFLRNVRRYGRKTALMDPATDRKWTYTQLNSEANKLAHALAQDGVGKNDVVMSVLANCPEFCFTYIGPRKIGAIINLANYKLSFGELALLIDHNEPKVIIYSAEVAEMVEKALQHDAPPELEMQITSRPDDKFGRCIVLLYHFAESSELLQSQLSHYASKEDYEHACLMQLIAALPKYWRPKYCCRTELPRTATSKPDRATAAKLAASLPCWPVPHFPD